MKKLTEKENALINEAHASGKCFVCQEKEPTLIFDRGDEAFKVCEGCASAIELENNMRKELYKSDLFKMTLGLPLPRRFTIKRLK